ncbi:MAG: M73 family metallopeptidase [Euryarchaeota archaeon]|nr:M73 family metallopeptidase [Euryarchaeota archaeon]
MNKLLTSLLMIGVVAAMAGAATWANFSDIETSTGNTFTAGTLDLVGQVTQVHSGSGTTTVYNPGGGANFYWTVSNIAPGSAGTDVWTLTNGGSIPGNLTIALTTTSNENTLMEPELALNDNVDDGELDNQMTFGLVRTNPDSSTNILVTAGSTIAVVETALDAEIRLMGSGEVIIYTLTWTLPDITNNNFVQSDSLVLDINFVLNQ